PTVTPRMLPTKHLLPVVKALPSPGKPIEITLSAPVMLAPASRPIAILLLPVQNLSAPRPKAWLLSPDTLSRSAAAPTAVLLLPSRLFNRANNPTAVLSLAVVFALSA